MRRFCRAIDRGEPPDDEVCKVLCSLFSATLKILAERGPDAKKKPARIMKALRLERGKGAKGRIDEQIDRIHQALEIEKLMAEGSKRDPAIYDVAKKYGVKVSTMKGIYANRRAAEAKFAAKLDARTEAAKLVAAGDKQLKRTSRRKK
jgi:hypothetical protein